VYTLPTQTEADNTAALRYEEAVTASAREYLTVLAPTQADRAEWARMAEDLDRTEDEASFAAQLAQHNLESPWFEEQELSELGSGPVREGRDDSYRI
jgi:hypothetical protein